MTEKTKSPGKALTTEALGAETLSCRAAGILLPVFSLPSPHGIGTMGRAAYEFCDFLAAAGQRIWQVLPLNPTGFGDSPYASFSVFAGNPYFIDLDMLAEDGLITKDEIEAADFGSDPRRVDYGRLFGSRMTLLRKAFERDDTFKRLEFGRFIEANESWLPDYALFTALKAEFGGKPWLEWEDEGIMRHRAASVRQYRDKLGSEIIFHEYVQYLFIKQWQKLKAYANSLGIAICGDIPIYCALDSADAWANPGEFMLSRDRRPKLVAGVPPDAFTEDGQLWGNPLYDWNKMKKSGYEWWIRRFKAAKEFYDIIRVDHFRGFESFWAVPAGESTARNGKWLPGPASDFIRAVKQAVPGLAMIAEDLGYITPEVEAMLKDSGCPGMKVMEFGFAPKAASNYVPFRHEENSVCYIGTHDNSPVLVWQHEIDEADVEFAKKYLSYSEEEGICRMMLRGGMESNSNRCV